MSYHKASALAHDDSDGGYLSDVIPSQNSNVSSQDQDLIDVAKSLDRRFSQHTIQFKERSDSGQAEIGSLHFSIKSLYEERVKALSATLASIYQNLCDDEVIQTMKKDKASVVFLPAHLNEVIERYLYHDREQFLHSALKKTAVLQSQLESSKTEIQRLKEDIQTRGATFSKQEEVFQNMIQELQENLTSKVAENDILRKIAEKKNHEISLLEQSFEQSSRELAIIEGLDKQEQQYKKDLKDQLIQVTSQRNSLSDEVQDLRTKCLLLTEENDRLHKDYQSKISEEVDNRKRIQVLMKQVETILDEDSQESHSAILTAHQKMKSFRDRMISELQREKRLSSVLQEELAGMKLLRDDINRENRRLQEENSKLREKITAEQMKCASANQELIDYKQRYAAAKESLNEMQLKYQYLEQRSADQSKVLENELKLREEKIRLDLKKQFEEEQRHLDQRNVTMKLHYSNELNKMSNQLRGSYNFNSGSTQTPDDVLEGLGTSMDGLATELSYRNLLEKLYGERDILTQNHQTELDSLRKKLFSEFEVKLQSSEKEWNARHESVVRGLKDMLTEASKNIDKLKSMVKEGRTVINMQNQRIDQLKKDNQSLLNLKVSIPHQSTHVGVQTLPLLFSANQNINPNLFYGAASSSVLPPTDSTQSITIQHTTVIDSSPEVVKLRTPDISVKLTSDDNESNGTYKGAQEQLGNRDFLNHSEERSLKSFSSKRSLDLETFKTKEMRIGSSNGSALSSKSGLFIAANTVKGESVDDSCDDLGPNEVEVQHDRDYGSVGSNGSSSKFTTAQLVNSALEESRLSKLQCLELEEQIKTLQSTIQQLKDVLHTSKLREESLQSALQTTTSDLVAANASVETLSRIMTSFHKEKLENDWKHNIDKENDGRNLETVSVMSAYSDSNLFQSASSILQSNNTVVSTRDNCPTETVPSNVGSVQRSFAEIGVNTLDNSISELSEKLASLELDRNQILDRSHHLEELMHLHQEDVKHERDRIVELKKKENHLYQLIVRIDSLYRQQLYALKQDLQHIRNITSNFASFTSTEIYTTINNYKLQFQVILDHYRRKQEQALKDQRTAVVTLHQKELNSLESRFIEQINLLNKKHTKELDKLHQELLTRTEQALNASAGRDTEIFSNIMNQSGYDNIVETGSVGNNISASSLLNRSLQMLSQATTQFRVPHGNGNSGLSDQEHLSIFSSNVHVPLAFESVLGGVLQGLIDQTCISNETTEKIVTLAKANQEPSFSAGAIARAIIGDEIDKYVMELMKNKYNLAIET